MESNFNTLDFTSYCSNATDGSAIVELTYHSSGLIYDSSPFLQGKTYADVTIDMNHEDLNFLNFQHGLPVQLLPPVDTASPAQQTDEDFCRFGSGRQFTTEFSPAPSSIDFSEGVPSSPASLPSSFNSPLHDGQVWQSSPLRLSAESPHFALLRNFALSDPNEHGSGDVGSSKSRSYSETMLGFPSKKFHTTSKRGSVSFDNLKADVSNFPALELPPEVLDSTLFNGDNHEPSLLGQLLPSTGSSTNPTDLGVPAGDNLLSSPGQLFIQKIAASSTVSRSNQRRKAVTKNRRHPTESRLSSPEMNMVPAHCARVTKEATTCNPTHAAIHQPTPTIAFHISLDEEAGDLTNLSLTKNLSSVLSNGLWNNPNKLGPRTNSGNLLAGQHISTWRNSTLRPHIAGALDRTSSVAPTVDSQPLETKAMKKVASHKLEANALKKRVRKPRHQCTRPGCGQTFTEKHNLYNHLNSHDGLKPHPCKHCNKTFAARSTLSRHSKTCASNIVSTDRKSVV